MRSLVDGSHGGSSTLNAHLCLVPLKSAISVRWFAAEYYQIPAGPNSNSLFGRINTLFACVGNFRFKHLETPKVPACDNARGRQFVEIPWRFPCLQGNLECWENQAASCE